MKRSAASPESDPPFDGVIEGDPPELAAATARGLADVAAGRTVPHAEVREWLLKWASGDPGPRPRKSLG